MLRERRWLWLLALAVVVVTTLPYLLAFDSGSGAWHFSGSLIGVQDGNSYVAKMLRGQAGDWLFRTPYTTVPQRGVPVFLPYLLLGKVAGGAELHLQLVALFHLFRIAGVLVSVWATHAFLSYFLEGPGARIWATALASLGAGLGWILPLLGSLPGWSGLPLSLISPEAFGFLGSFAVPHQAMARGTLLLTLLAYLRSLGQTEVGWGPPILALATFLLNPIAGVVVALVIVGHRWAGVGRASRSGAWEHWWRGTRRAAWTLALAAPYVVTLYFLSIGDPFLRGWAAQNQILSPHLGYYLLGYGLVLPLAAFGALHQLRFPGKEGSLLPVTWALLLPALAYAPVGIQRRLTEGGWVVLVLLATFGLIHLPLRERVKRWILAGIFAFSLPSTALVLIGALERARAPAWPAFVPDDQVAAFRYLAQAADPDEIVLASFGTSNALPAWAPLRVPIGHGPESVGLDERQREVERFFAAASVEMRASILEATGAHWFIVGPAERALGWEAQAGRGPWHRAGEWGAYAVFRVEPGE